jgi:hypothetical protein
VESVGGVSLFGDIIEVNGENVVAGLKGFAAGTTFLMAKGQRNDAVLRASFTANPITVESFPSPAAGWLLIAGLGGLAALKPRKKASKHKYMTHRKGGAPTPLFVSIKVPLTRKQNAHKRRMITKLAVRPVPANLEMWEI